MGATMKRLNIAIAMLLVLAFAATAISNIVGTDRQLMLQDVQIKSKDAELKQLQLDLIEHNKQLEDALQSDDIDQDKIKRLEQETKDLQEKNQQLERELSAKKEAQRIAKEQTQNAASLAAQASAAALPADPQGWLAAAGIAQSDWYYVDCVINGCNGVSAEGGWSGALRWNTTGSGAYGICQALPASKMASAGADYMTNPITQLKWCHAYAQGYGSWAAAWKFRTCLGSCYSPRTNTTVIKDHTWW